jgi:hypothetical protein
MRGVDNRIEAVESAISPMTDGADPYRSVARELLCVLADAGRPMSLRELEEPGRFAGADAAFQLSVARVAGFVRAVPNLEQRPEPSYQPTTLGWMIARRTSRAGMLARQLREADDAPWADESPSSPRRGHRDAAPWADEPPSQLRRRRTDGTPRAA